MTVVSYNDITGIQHQHHSRSKEIATQRLNKRIRCRLT